MRNGLENVLVSEIVVQPGDNVIRTVEAFEDAGAAALHIEDQVWPSVAASWAASKWCPPTR